MVIALRFVMKINVQPITIGRHVPTTPVALTSARAVFRKNRYMAYPYPVPIKFSVSVVYASDTLIIFAKNRSKIKI